MRGTAGEALRVWRAGDPTPPARKSNRCGASPLNYQDLTVEVNNFRGLDIERYQIPSNEGCIKRGVALECLDIRSGSEVGFLALQHPRTTDGEIS
jgi:hypothetical protein